MTIKLTSTAFEEGQTIPKKYTGAGEDVSPPLQWDNVPKDARSLALICDDPDAPRGTWVHWVLFNLPADQNQLDEAVPTDKELPGGARQGKNDFGDIGYGGPAPPKGKPHRYFFQLFALDTKLELAPQAKRSEILTALAGHVLAKGQLMGLYKKAG